MKKIVFCVTGICVAGALQVLGQGGPGGGGGGQDPGGPGSGLGTNYASNASWSNYFAKMGDGGHGTNMARMSNAPAPAAWSHKYQKTYGLSDQEVPAGQNRTRFGQKELPADAQEMIQQFQQDRTRLMTQLKTCTDEERQQLLKEMEQLRLQLREHIAQFREQAKEQAEQMRHRFANERDRMLDQGAGNGNGGRGGRDR